MLPMSPAAGLIGGGLAPYPVGAVNFDGTNDYGAALLASISDSKSGIVSVWNKAGTTGGNNFFIYTNTGGYVNIYKNNVDKYIIEAYNAAASQILLLTSNTAYTANWRHIAASWDLAAGLAHLYIDGADDEGAGTVKTNDTIDYTRASHSVGATVLGASLYNGDMAELYFAAGQYADITVPATLQKWRRSNGTPANLGTDGSTPTGTAPTALWRCAAGAAAGTFYTDVSGNGNTLTEVGTLTTATTSPSD